MEEQDKARARCVPCKGQGYVTAGDTGPRLGCPYCNPCETCGGYAPWRSESSEVAAKAPPCGCEQYFWNPLPTIEGEI